MFWLIVGDLHVDLQLEDMIDERNMFVRDIHAKELDILELKKDNKKLTIVRGPGLDAGKDLHERVLPIDRRSQEQQRDCVKNWV